MSVEHIPDTLADHCQELVTRCGFSVSFDAEGVFISENCSNGRTARFSEGIAAISALHLEIIENQLQRLQEVEQENVALWAKVAKLEAAISWALGEAGSDFRGRRENEGPYWWRKEFRIRARGREGE